MSRYTGPRVKRMRALGIDLPGLSRKSMWDRPYPPGVHGPKSARRRKMSDFKKQLLEKQKLRFNYGLNEGQFMRLYREAVHSKEPSGDKLLELLERRLDNTVFRAGFAPTIPAARQLVCHGHFLVNGRRLDIPSYRVREGDVISLRERSQNLSAVDASLEDVRLARPDWIEFDEATKTATIKSLPKVDSVPFPLEIDLVIEYYSKRL
ncbi:MAG: 30S ribosomal protein S4 [Myxococcales bacterium SG8_38]|nr:MAG: 30S ribosomal protein S4 [Myxococcales bacterium SG8_38]